MQAPRWVLLAVVMLLSGYAGLQYKENAYLSASLQDGPSKFQQRQGERLASLEAEVKVLARAVDGLAAASGAQNLAIAKLTTQVELSRTRR